MAEMKARNGIIGFCLIAALFAGAPARAESESSAPASASVERKPGLEVYGAVGYVAESGDIYGGNGDRAYSLGLNSWLPTRFSGWGSFLGIDLSLLGGNETRSGTAFPFQGGRALTVFRQTLNLNFCGGLDRPVAVCFGIGYAIVAMDQGGDYHQTYGAPVYALHLKAPFGERWIAGLVTDWMRIDAKVNNSGASVEYWRSAATIGYRF